MSNSSLLKQFVFLHELLSLGLELLDCHILHFELSLSLSVSLVVLEKFLRGSQASRATRYSTHDLDVFGENMLLANQHVDFFEECDILVHESRIGIFVANFVLAKLRT